MMIIILSIVFFIIDQLSKLLVIKKLNMGSSNTIINGFFYLTRANNDGAAFSIFTGKKFFLIAITFIIIAGLIYYIKKNKPKDKLTRIAYSLIIGGSLGNLIDRIIRGTVIDFLDFRILGYNYPIFNIADTFIVVGVFLMFITMMRKDRKNDNR